MQKLIMLKPGKSHTNYKNFKLFTRAENDTTREYLEQTTQQVIISTAVFLIRNENIAMANTAAITTKQHRDANNGNSN